MRNPFPFFLVPLLAISAPLYGLKCFHLADAMGRIPPNMIWAGLMERNTTARSELDSFIEVLALEAGHGELTDCTKAIRKAGEGKRWFYETGRNLHGEGTVIPSVAVLHRMRKLVGQLDSGPPNGGDDKKLPFSTTEPEQVLGSSQVLGGSKLSRRDFALGLAGNLAATSAILFAEYQLAQAFYDMRHVAVLAMTATVGASIGIQVAGAPERYVSSLLSKMGAHSRPPLAGPADPFLEPIQYLQQRISSPEKGNIPVRWYFVR